MIRTSNYTSLVLMKKVLLFFEKTGVDRLLKWHLLLLLLKRSAFRSCADDKEIVSGLYISERKITSVLAL